MDYRKLDAALAAALADADAAAPLAVFIRTVGPPSAADAALLSQHGVREDPAGRVLFTASLTPRAVAELSDQSWVRSLRLARPLRLLAGEGS